MKKNILICCFIISVSTMMGQARQGTFSIVPRVGVSLANLSDNDLHISTDGSITSKSKAGFTVGADAIYQATDRIAISAGVFYTSLGYKYDDYDLLAETPDADATEAKYTAYTDLNTTIGYVTVPVMGHIYIAKGLAVKAGVQAGFFTSAKSEYTTRDFTQNIRTGVRTYSNQTSTVKDTSDEGYNKVDISIPLGVSYEYMNVVLDARYNIGCTKVIKDTSSKNQFFTFTVGYKFNL